MSFVYLVVTLAPVRLFPLLSNGRFSPALGMLLPMTGTFSSMNSRVNAPGLAGGQARHSPSDPDKWSYFALFIDKKP